MSVLGHHTAAELADWLRAVDYQVTQTSRAFGEFSPTWLTKDPEAFRAWDADWRAFQTRYGAAHAKAERVVRHASLLPVPDTAYPAEDEWQGIHLALAQTPGTVAKGDLQDLYNRLIAAGKPIDFSKMPQPRTGLDIDLSVYKAADDTIKAGERAADAVARALPSASAVGAGVLALTGVVVVAGVAGLVLASRFSPMGMVR